ncbi:Hypp3599 [Branchiostoma lanceolatum]|uniref:Hypp3599 protein n=1 Tax=Branchiostoma lanceolatum TaxID=7740 RepID=A0A8K0A1I4_BRALA|nr:Hypp3599 [Branchiostoma lanceolatum]
MYRQCVGPEEGPSQGKLDYGWKLGMERVLPHIRARSLNGLPSVVQQKIRLMLGQPDNTDNTEHQKRSGTFSATSERRSDVRNAWKTSKALTQRSEKMRL